LSTHDAHRLHDDDALLALRPRLLAASSDPNATIAQLVGVASAANRSAVSTAVFRVAEALGRGLLIGAGAGGAAQALQSSIFSISTARFTSAALRAEDTKFGVTGSLASVLLPASALGDAFAGNMSALPPTIDAVFMVCARNIFLGTDLAAGGGAPQDTPIVSLR
jgi:hypothetical protein